MTVAGAGFSPPRRTCGPGHGAGVLRSSASPAASWGLPSQTFCYLPGAGRVAHLLRPLQFRRPLQIAAAQIGDCLIAV